MKRVESFFVYCSGASFSILKRCPTELSKYVGVGATIFFTGLLASISAGYALFMVFGSYLYAIFFGLIWGLMIFNLDRYIVLSMRKNGVWYEEYLQAIPRIVLALLIALVISKPLEIKIFEKEIESELTNLEEEIRLEQERIIDHRYSYRLDSLNESMLLLKGEIKKKEQKRDALVKIAQQEADGTGGSGKVNPGPIYSIKNQNANRVQQELDLFRNQHEKSISHIEILIQSLNKEKTNAIQNLEISDTSGIMFRLIALERLGDKYPIISLANWFIILLFISLELAPILTKLISNRGPYDDLLEIHEHLIKNLRKEKVQISDLVLEKKLANI